MDVPNVELEQYLESTKTAILKRKVGYGEVNNTNEEEQTRSEKRNKMDIDSMMAGVSSGV